MRERESYLKSVSQVQRDVPTMSSMYHHREDSVAREARRQYNLSPDYLAGRNLQSASVNSLHYMSNGLSSDRD